MRMDISSQSDAKLGPALTLQAYVDILLEASIHGLPSLRDIEPSTEKRRAVRELLDAQLLSNQPLKVGPMIQTERLVLTPRGAAALVEWSEFLSKQTWRHKALTAASQLWWVVIGALAASVPDLIEVFRT